MYSDAISPARQALLRAYFARLERGEWDKLVALCDDDVVYRMPAATPQQTQTIVGKDAFRQFSAETFAEFLEPRFAATDMRVLGEAIVVDYDGTWRTKSGERASLPGAILFTFRGDKISEIAVRVDLRGLNRPE